MQRSARRAVIILAGAFVLSTAHPSPAHATVCHPLDPCAHVLPVDPTNPYCQISWQDALDNDGYGTGCEIYTAAQSAQGRAPDPLTAAEQCAVAPTGYTTCPSDAARENGR